MANSWQEMAAFWQFLAVDGLFVGGGLVGFGGLADRHVLLYPTVFMQEYFYR